MLITSGEHYGAVLNPAFDYRAYLRVLESHEFNLTRIFSGAYCEPPGAHGIVDNTLAPAPGRLLCPWARSSSPGYANGGNKFDLTRWDAAYFQRLVDFVAEAGQRGVVVEMVLFCPFYDPKPDKDMNWKLSPMNAANNVNGVGNVARNEVYTLESPSLVAVHEAMVRKIVEALRDADNVYFEICNEPYHGGVTAEWQDRIAEVISDAEARLERKHLIAQNIANKSAKVKKPNPRVSILNLHYAKPDAVSENYALNLAIADDETGFRGSKPEPYRLEGWNFLLAGGAVCSNLDYSFTCGKETGTATSPAPGGGGAEIRRQLAILKRFIEGFDFVRMKPDNLVITSITPDAVSGQALVEPGRAYAVYLIGTGPASVAVALPSGTYEARWINTKTGEVQKAETIEPSSGMAILNSPAFDEDIALGIKSAAISCGRSTDAEAPDTGQSPPSADAYRNKFAVWDAEGQHLSTDDILAMHRDYGVSIYFFRDEEKHNLQLKILKQHGLILVKTAHPNYEPFRNEEFLSSPERVRRWAREAAAHPFVDGLALDIELSIATTHADVLTVLSAEAHKQGKLLHAVPHFRLFERFSGPLTPDDFNRYADIVWPWLYNRLDQTGYKQGLMVMMKYWTDKGVKVPVYPIFDHGRTSYSGITPAEAADVPGHLATCGVSTVCLFQPHSSYWELQANPDYRRLWSGLRENFGSRSSSRPSDEQHRASSRPSPPDSLQSK